MPEYNREIRPDFNVDQITEEMFMDHSSFPGWLRARGDFFVPPQIPLPPDPDADPVPEEHLGHDREKIGYVGSSSFKPSDWLVGSTSGSGVDILTVTEIDEKLKADGLFDDSQSVPERGLTYFNSIYDIST